MKLVLLAVVLFAYVAPGLSNTACYKMGLIRSQCHGYSKSTVFKSIPGPRGPRGPKGKPSTKCRANDAALLRLVAGLEKQSKQCFNRLNQLWKKVQHLSKNQKAYRRPSPPHQRYTYKAYYHSTSWHEARRYCIRQGGDLAYHGMKTAHQRKVAHQRYRWRKTHHFHIGLNDWLQERLYRYPDGTVVDNKRVGWNRNEPNGGRRENFGSIWYNSFVLNDLPYNYRVPFICEYPVYKKRTLVHFLYRGGLTSNQGLNVCRQHGGTLASDGMPFNKRRSLIGGMGCPNGVVHVGWNDKRRENHWVNSAGNREFSRAYLHWNTNWEGKRGRSENCAAMLSPSGKLFDISCNRQRYWIMCQKLI